ncbi:MAG: signal peptidase II [Anaerolineae bacterium]
MRRLRAEELLLPGVALLVLVLDQVTKGLIVARMTLGQSMDLTPWLAPVFRLTYITNTGVAFGLFPGLGDFFIIVDLVVVVVLMIYNRWLPAGNWIMRVALGFQLGGALGNVTDRLLRGAVVDFLDLNFWPLKTWPVGNLADVSIVAGVVLLGIMILFEGKEQERPEEASQESAT